MHAYEQTSNIYLINKLVCYNHVGLKLYTWMPSKMYYFQLGSNEIICCVESRQCNKAFHDACVGPMRLLLSDTFCGMSPSLLQVYHLCVA
jgi:hypothetical protein